MKIKAGEVEETVKKIINRYLIGNLSRGRGEHGR